MTGPLTLELRAILGPELAEVFAELGHDLLIVRPTEPSGTWGSEGASESRQTVRGLLMPASRDAQRAAAGSGLPVPAFEAYLPFDAALLTPGWHLEHEGTAYYPSGDARDEGGQGLALVVPLTSPGQVTGDAL